VLLRREFLKWREWKREISDVARKVLVTLGGGDPENVTLKVIQALQQVKGDGLEAVAVVGASNPHYQAIQAVAHASRFPIRLESNAMNMPELMAWADVAVSSGGSTCWELAFMGVPAVLLVTATNQIRVTESLHRDSIAVSLGTWNHNGGFHVCEILQSLAKDANRRKSMSRAGQELIDGLGATHIITAMAQARVECLPQR
jgi:spore coat polysaccharide biosynthesis predicted glycosyltransferase SpsG